MSHTTRFYAPEHAQTHTSKPLDEAVWRAWIEKNLGEERSRAAARTRAVNWICIGVLASAAVTSPHLSLIYVPGYQAMVRLAIGVGATVIMFDHLRTRNYGFTALFAAMVLLFNPLLPAFTLSRNESTLLASILPFVASLLWMRHPAQARHSPFHKGALQTPLSETLPHFD